MTSTVYATNGYFAHGYSTKEKGLAGAGVAYSQDALAAANNPAGMAFVGERMDLGIAVFDPNGRGVTITGTTNPDQFVNADPSSGAVTYTSDDDMFLIPSFGYNWQVDSDSAMGISVYGNGGMNTAYEASATPFGAGLFGAGDAGINLAQAFFNLSLAKKTSSNSAVGVSLILAGQRFAAKGLDGFGMMAADGNGSDISGNVNSYSQGFGFKLGYQGELVSGLTLGISYQSEIAMGKFDEYSDLFAEAGGFDIPSTHTIGLAYDMGSAGTVVLDVQRINYTDVASVSNPVQNLFVCMGAMGPADPSYCLGGSNGAGFGWNDITVVKLGYEVIAGGNTYRVGYSKTDIPIDGGMNPMTSQTFFNLLAPATVEEHLTFGMTMPVGKDQEFNLALMIAPNESVTGANPFDMGATQIEIEMEQQEIQVGWAWKY
ncbi:MAG: outer membrane protein transport protein [Gammaproteobacteria bacterium]|nr:outer membrane protein transport protein [Gammaproteobacteria bacterium]